MTSLSTPVRRSVLSVLIILATLTVSTALRDPEKGNHTAKEPPTENVNNDKTRLKAKVKEMFMHGYSSYMKYAFPHDEILPIACTPRIRDVTVSRGDVDDILGNFSLTLIDSLDTLVVLGELDEFESAIKKLVKNVRFDTDLAVSVFETNIRIVGGLISGHILAKYIQANQPLRLTWYSDELLHMTVDIADRLLPAFNTTSGLPHPRVNLKHGMQKRLKDQVDTCTACGGTMILEMAALSRLTGNSIYERKARKAMDFLWAQRNHGSDLVGTVLNVESGNWVRREASIGAGVDSYMEYSLKAYMLLGEDDFLYRFNKHYDAIVRYLSKGPMFVDVHMHRPNVASRPYMDSLSAFWPGLQVLKGDLKSAIEVHEMLYHVVQKYKFLPEAFTHDFQIHWGQHPLRPEFIESTYILYRATRDPHYLKVAEQMLESIEKYTRVACGFAGIKDLRTMEHEDQMDSFVLAETFKYLYMIFSEPSELPFDPDNYILTTEAHFLPLTIGDPRFGVTGLPRRVVIDPDEVIDEDTTPKYTSACPNVASQLRTIDELSHFGSTVRQSVKKLLSSVVTTNRVAPTSEDVATCKKTSARLRAWAFSPSNVDHILELKALGIDVHLDENNQVSLTLQVNKAKNLAFAQCGIELMKDLSELNQAYRNEIYNVDKIQRSVQVVSTPMFGKVAYSASPAQFGMNLNESEAYGQLALAIPLQACEELKNTALLAGKIVVVRRGNCMFQEKARFAQNAGAAGVIVLDSEVDTSFETSPLFSMSGDNLIKDDIIIPVVFLFALESQKLLNQHFRRPIVVRLGRWHANPRGLFVHYLKTVGQNKSLTSVRTEPSPPTFNAVNQMLALTPNLKRIRINFRFGKLVEQNVALFFNFFTIKSAESRRHILHSIRCIAYYALGLEGALDVGELTQFFVLLPEMILVNQATVSPQVMNQFESLGKVGRTTSVVCGIREHLEYVSCEVLKG